jgi:N-acetylmuramoyl-L-alanine amidase
VNPVKHLFPRRRCGRLPLALLVACCFALVGGYILTDDSALADDPAEVGDSIRATVSDQSTAADNARPALSVESLEFLPGQGRASRSYLLYQFSQSDEPCLDLWDAVQILHANRYFDPVTRKVALGLDENRVKLTDNSPWIFIDGRPRLLGDSCRMFAGRFYVPLSFWSILLEELPDLRLRQDPERLRLIGGLRTVNVLGVEWSFSGERLRGVFQLSEPLEPTLERLGDSALRITIGGGRLADHDWRRLPGLVPVDSVRVSSGAGGAVIEIHFRRALGELRSSGHSSELTWVFTADLPSVTALPEPDFEPELAERLPGVATGERRLQRIILDPGHGGRDTGAVVGSRMEKSWNLRFATWLEPFLEAEGFTVLWTRRDDRDRLPSARVQAANVANGDLYLSLHFTRRGAMGENGLEIVLQEARGSLLGKGNLQPWASVQAEHAESSLEIAAGIQQAMGVLTGWSQLGIRRANTAILEGLDMPALMLEIDNLDSAIACPAWEDRPTRERRLKILAQALAYRAKQWRKGGR